MTTLDSAEVYAHDAHCNVIHIPGPEPCPRWCDHEWRVAEFGTSRSCGKCSSVVTMSALGMTFSGWAGNEPENLSRWRSA